MIMSHWNALKVECDMASHWNQCWNWQTEIRDV